MITTKTKCEYCASTDEVQQKIIDEVCNDEGWLIPDVLYLCKNCKDKTFVRNKMKQYLATFDKVQKHLQDVVPNADDLNIQAFVDDINLQLAERGWQVSHIDTEYEYITYIHNSKHISKHIYYLSIHEMCEIITTEEE